MIDRTAKSPPPTPVISSTSTMCGIGNDEKKSSVNLTANAE